VGFLGELSSITDVISRNLKKAELRMLFLCLGSHGRRCPGQHPTAGYSSCVLPPLDEVSGLIGMPL
jgi:hypothetical protein